MRYNLSEITQLIKDRRTIYPEQFSDRKVHKEQIMLLLENARWAPTHKLTQPWLFKVFYGKGLNTFSNWHAETYKKITAIENFSENKYKALRDRPLKASAVIALAMRRDEKLRIPEVEELASTAAAVQNMLLTAAAYGLAAYWGSGGLTFHPEMKTFLGLKPNDQCLGLLFIGYPEIDWPRPTPRKPTEYFSEWVED